MNDITRWVLGAVFALILGAYGYTYTTVQATEDRIVSQIQRELNSIDVHIQMLERKQDRMLEHQYNQRTRR